MLSAKKLGIQPQAKILSLSDGQWDELEILCAKELGLPSDWKEKSYNSSIKSLRARDRSGNYQEYKLYYKDKVHTDKIAPKKEALPEDDNLTLF
jgi:hypothetical protein